MIIVRGGKGDIVPKKRIFNFQFLIFKHFSWTSFVATFIIGVFVYLFIGLFPQQAGAAVGINKTINFQGKLVGNSGVNVADGNYSVVFTLYDAASNGNNLWDETQTVSTIDGIFQVELGTVDTTLGNVNFNSDSIYLGVKVGADNEMTPRIRFGAVPYAFNSTKVNGLTVTNTSDNPFSSTTVLKLPDGNTYTVASPQSGTSDTIGTLTSVSTLTNKSIGSTGLTFSGATNDITTGTNEDLTFALNGSGDLVMNSDFDSGVSIGSSSNTPAVLSVSGGIGSNASLIVNNTNAGDLFVASQSGTTKFRIGNNGDVYVSAGINAGGTLGSSAQCLTGGAAVAWTACSGLGTNYWQLTNGTISPFSDTLDLLVGGVSSTSAKFKVSPNGTSPTASVSANTSAAGLIVDNIGAGDLFTASKTGATKFVIKNDGTIGLDTANYASCGTLTTDASALITCGTAAAGNGDNLLGVYAITAPSGANLTINFDGAANAAVSSSGGTLTFPSNAAKLVVELKAGGGGGGGVGTANATPKVAGGGAEGGYSRKIITSLSSNYYVKVGGGGAGGTTSGTNGVQGSQSCLGTNASDACTNALTNATGGTGGTGSNATGQFAGGTGGSGVNGDLVLTGAPGGFSSGATSGIFSGSGGGISGGIGRITTGNGNNGANGGGGGGGYNSGNNNTATGGNGGNGYVLVYVYSSNEGNAAWTQFTGGVLAPADLTTDVLIGGSSTASARFGILNIAAGGTPTASLSAGAAGGAYLTSTGILQTTANQTLTLGGLTTGNILLNPQGNNFVGIGTNAPIAPLDVRTALNTGPTASFSGNSTFAGLVIDNKGSGDIFAASKAGVTKFAIRGNGDLVATNYVGPNAVILGSNGNGVLGMTSTTSTGQCLVSGASAASWGSCSSNPLTTNGGLLYNGQSTMDFVLGGTTTASASFAVTGNNGGQGALGLWATNTGNPLPGARNNAPTVTANGYIYIFGGFNGTATQSNVLYAKVNSDGSIGQWVTTTPLPLALDGHAAVVSNGYVYIVGGEDGTFTAQTGVYYAKLNNDGTLGPWSVTTSLPAAKQALSAVAANGYLYAVGGGSGTTASNTVYYAKLNPDGSVSPWTTATNLLAARMRHAAFAANGYLYAVGGDNGGSQTTVYFTKLNSNGSIDPWSQTTVLPVAKAGHTVSIANGYVYVVGGSSGSPTLNNVTATSYYARINANGTIGSWSAGPSIPAVRGGAGSVVSNGYIYVIGGDATDLFNFTNPQTTIYYASTARVSLTASLDLIGLSGTSLASASGGVGNGSVGGSIYAGNIFSNGDLTIAGNTQLFNGLGVVGGVNVNGGFNVAGGLGTVATASISGQTSNAAMIVNNSGAGDVFAASSSGLTRFVIKQNGTVGIGTTVPTLADKLQVAATSVPVNDLVQFGNVVGQEPTANGISALQTTWRTKPAAGNINSASRIDLFNSNTATGGQTQGMRIVATGPGGAINSETVGLLIDPLFSASTGTANQNAIEIGGNWDSAIYGQSDLRVNAVGNIIFATSSATTRFGYGTANPLATFDVRGNSFVAPVASISGSSGKAALVVDQTNVGDIFAASSSGVTQFVIKSGGQVGIGTAVPLVNLDIRGASNATASLSAGLVGATYFTGTGSLQTTNNQSLTLGGTTTGNILINHLGGNYTGIGTNNPLASLDIRSTIGLNGGTISVASVSGKTSYASMVVNNTGNGDLFTASASGTTRFRITQTGSVLFQGDVISASGSGQRGNGSATFVNALGDQGSLIPNSSFEANTYSPGGIPDGWVTSASSSATAAAIDRTTAVHGDASLRVTVNNSAVVVNSTCVPVQLSNLSGSYTATYYAKASQATAFPTVRGYVDTFTSKANCQSGATPITSSSIPTSAVTANFAISSSLAVTNQGSGTWARIRFYVQSTTASNNSVNIDGVRFVQTAATNGLDYAENYPADPINMPEAGDVVALRSVGSVAQVTKAIGYMAQDVIGVVSTNPGQTLDDGSMGENKVAIALAGRIPTKVSTKNGEIHVGDYLTSSDIPGVAVKALNAGPVIGQAMEVYTEADMTKIGKVVMFVKNTYYNGFPLGLNSGLVEDGAQPDLIFLGALIHESEKKAASISALTQLKADKVVAGLSVIAPNVVTDTVQLNTIKPATGNDVTIELPTDGSLVVKNASSEAGITFKGNGDATFAGNVQTEGLTVTGTLIADKLQVKELEIPAEAWAQAFESGALESLEARILKQESRITDLEALFASASAVVEATATPTPVASESAFSFLAKMPTIEDFEKPNAGIFDFANLSKDSLATYSGKLAADKLQVTGSAIIEGILHVVDFLTTRNLIVDQLATFLGDSVFKGHVLFESSPTFSSDTAGLAVIKKGSDRVEVKFSKEYNMIPLVSANLTVTEVSPIPHEDIESLIKRQDALEQQVLGNNARYVVTKRTTKGFIILLAKPAADDMTFSWMAVGVDKPVVQASNGDKSQLYQTSDKENARPISSEYPNTMPTSSILRPTEAILPFPPEIGERSSGRRGEEGGEE